MPLALLGPCGSPVDRASRSAGPATARARVLEVIDGDTIRVRLAEGELADVRYIGVDTPESVHPDQPLQCFGKRASRINEELVGGRVVTLRFGPERRDDYGRLLAYVYAGRRMVNASLLRRGLARTLSIAPNDALATYFSRLAAGAGRAGRGLWGDC